MRTWGAILGIAAVVVACGAAARADEAETAFQSLYGADYAGVLATPQKTDDVELAGKLVEAARATKGQTKLVELLCRKAYELAHEQREGYDTAAAALNLLAEAVPAARDDSWAKLLDVYQACFNAGRGAERAAAGERLVWHLVAMADAAGGRGDYGTAAQHLRRASAVAGACSSPSWKAVRAKLKEINDRVEMVGEIQSLEAKLGARPTDTASRRRLVHLLLVECDDPKAAARVVAADCPEEMRTYVPLAAKDPASLAGDEARQLGDWYRRLAGAAKGTARVDMLRRAQACYTAFLAGHTEADAARTTAELALKKTNEELGDQAGPSVPAPGPVAQPQPPVRPHPSGAGGEALSDLALVTAPAKLRGAKSWTIETVRPRGALTDVSFSPDGRLIALATEGCVRLLDATDGKLIRILAGYGVQAQFSPDGKLLATCADRFAREGLNLCLADPHTGRQVSILDGDLEEIGNVRWSRDGVLIAAVTVGATSPPPAECMASQDGANGHARSEGPPTRCQPVVVREGKGTGLHVGGGVDLRCRHGAEGEPELVRLSRRPGLDPGWEDPGRLSLV